MAVVIIILIGVFALAVLPQMWVKGVIERHSGERADFAGTGGEFARHVLNEMGLTNVNVEETEEGDHYDPESKTVRLLPQHLNGRSLTAVVIAAHEVGHAMQDATDYGPLKARTKLAKQAQRVESIGAFVMLAAPVMMILAKSPHMLFLEMLAGAVILGITVVMHATTLPVEFDASFKRALPLLKAGNYISEPDMQAARQILRAAAFTYVASAAMSLLNVARWLRVLRF